MLLAATALTPLPRLSQGWCNRSGRITGRAFVGRSGLVSGDICIRENADGDIIAKGRNSDQQKPHFELDGVRALVISSNYG